MSKSQGASRPAERIGRLLFVAAQAAQTLATEKLAPLGLSAKADSSNACATRSTGARFSST